MSKPFFVLMAAGLLFVMALNTSSAGALHPYLSENWDGYTSGATPYGPNNDWNWGLVDGTWMGLTGGQALSPEQSYSIAFGQTSRIRMPIDFDGLQEGNDPVDHIVLQGWFYDYGTPSNSWLGLGKADGEGYHWNNGTIRIGMDGSSSYKVQYGDYWPADTAPGLVTVDTEMPISVGWHYARIEIVDLNIWGFWRATWMIGSDYQGDYADIGPGSGSFGNWAQGHFDWWFNRAEATNVLVGSESPVGGQVDWDDIMAGSYDYVGAPVPEPGSLFVLAAGLVGMAGFFGRRRA